SDHAAPHGVVERRVSQANVALPVETDPMELDLEMIVTVAGGVEHDACVLVHLYESRDFERLMSGQRRDQCAVQVVEIEIGEAVALRLPNEATVVGEKL